jgi:hypothetical protein
VLKIYPLLLDEEQIGSVDANAPEHRGDIGGRERAGDHDTGRLVPEPPAYVAQRQANQESGQRREHDDLRVCGTAHVLAMHQAAEVLRDAIAAPPDGVQRPEHDIAVALELVEVHPVTLSKAGSAVQ